MIPEQAIQEALAAYPAFIEPGLRLIRKEAALADGRHRRLDLLFHDREGRRLLIELKRTMIHDKDVGQLLRYAGMLLRSEGPAPPLRLMLIGTRVGPNLQSGLGHTGIEWRELDVEQLRQFVPERGDERVAGRLGAGTADYVEPGRSPATLKPPNGHSSEPGAPGGSAFSVSVAGQRIGPARFPVVMQELFRRLISEHGIAPESLLPCSNVRGKNGKQRWEVLPFRVATREEFARHASDSLCEQGRFAIFEAAGKTCGITTHWGSGGSRRVIRQLQRKFPQLEIKFDL